MDKIAIDIIKEWARERFHKDLDVVVCKSPIDMVAKHGGVVKKVLPDNVHAYNRSLYIELTNDTAFRICSLDTFAYSYGWLARVPGFGFLIDPNVHSIVDSAFHAYRFPRNDERIADWRQFTLSIKRRVWGMGSKDNDNELTRETIDLKDRVFGMMVAKEWVRNRDFERVLYAIERPTVIRTKDGKPHAIGQPAIEFSDGWQIYAVNGVLTRKQPRRGITASFINRARNVEERRVLIEAVGFDQFVELCGGYMMHSDGYGDLYKFPALPRENEFLKMVKVVNSTPEPDGSYKDYFLRVPPNMKTAEQAVAWTFGMEAGQYQPVVQT